MAKPVYVCLWKIFRPHRLARWDLQKASPIPIFLQFCIRLKRCAMKRVNNNLGNLLFNDSFCCQLMHRPESISALSKNKFKERHKLCVVKRRQLPVYQILYINSCFNGNILALYLQSSLDEKVHCFLYQCKQCRNWRTQSCQLIVSWLFACMNFRRREKSQCMYPLT